MLTANWEKSVFLAVQLLTLIGVYQCVWHGSMLLLLLVYVTFVHDIISMEVAQRSSELGTTVCPKLILAYVVKFHVVRFDLALVRSSLVA